MVAINNYLAWILVSGYLHAKSYKVISLEMLSSETLMCRLFHKNSSHLHTTCQMETHGWCALVELAVLPCNIETLQRLHPWETFWEPLYKYIDRIILSAKMSKDTQFKSGNFIRKAIFLHFIHLMEIRKTCTQLCGCTSLQTQYELFNETDYFIWPALGWAEHSIDCPHFSPLPTSDSFKHSYLTFRWLTKDR